MEKKAIIVCPFFLKLDGSDYSIGGSESYFYNLAMLLRYNNFEILILQNGLQPFYKNIDSIRIIGCTSIAEKDKILKSEFNNGSSIVFYSDFFSLTNYIPHPSVVINHGVMRDFTTYNFTNKLVEKIINFKRKYDQILLASRILSKMKKVDKVITVDTNFQNWMRIQFRWRDFEDKFVYVPNFANPISEDKIFAKINKKKIDRVLFARRFTKYRGIFLWVNVVKKLIIKYPAIEFVFCGSGDSETIKFLKNEFGNYEAVKIYETPYQMIMEEHYAADIEIIPSLGSEGTSFSAIEAMAAGCAVVATNIGGLGNIIIPEYNGILVQPTEKDLERAVVRLIENPSFARKLGKRAYDVVKVALNKERWEKQIMEIVNGLI
ncbi:MAG: glycosyltransferase family 4 protein [Candidatus Aenigmatarchaeota archaeon]